MALISGKNIRITVRDYESYDNNLKFVLDLITFNEVANVVGSYKYTTHRYASDIDVFDAHYVELNATEASKFYETQFKIIFSKLLINSSSIIINDFKCGESSILRQIYRRSDLSLNNLQIKDQLKALFSPQTFNDLYSIKSNILFYEELRRMAALRWMPEEVLLGQKISIFGEVVTLRDALSQPAIVKLDVISYIVDRFQSIEVLYNLNYTESKNITNKIDNNLNKIISKTDNTSKQVLNKQTSSVKSFFPLADYKESLIQDIEKYSSPPFYNPLKASKRGWILARISGCMDLLEALNPLMESDSAALNQVRSDIEVIIDIIDKKRNNFNVLKGLNVNFDGARLTDVIELNKLTDKLFTQMLNLSKRLSNHLDMNIYNEIKPYFKNIFEEWVMYNSSGRFNGENVKNILLSISFILSKEIIKESAQFLEDVQKMNIQCKVINFDGSI